MTQQNERRRAERRTEDDVLAPEYLALLEVCGGEMRAADRTLLEQRRRRIEGAEASGEAKPAETAEVPRLPADRRAVRS